VVIDGNGIVFDAIGTHRIESSAWPVNQVYSATETPTSRQIEYASVR